MPDLPPFQYSVRQANIPWEDPDAARKVVEQRDRELEDYLKTLHDGSADGAPFYAGAVCEFFGTGGFDTVVPRTETPAYWNYGDVFDTETGGSGVGVLVSGYIRIHIQGVMTAGEETGKIWNEPFSLPAGFYVVTQDETATSILAYPSVSMVEPHDDPPIGSVSLSGSFGPIPVPAGGGILVHGQATNTDTQLFAVLGLEWAGPL